MKRVIALSLLVAAFTGTAVASPPNDATFRGRTSQHLKATVVVRGGRVRLVKIPWRARHCTPRDGYVVTFPHFNFSDDPNGPIEQTPQLERFTDGGGPVVIKAPGSRIVVTGSHLSGRFVGDDTVKGTLRARVRARDKYGRHRCSQRIRWSAKLVR